MRAKKPSINDSYYHSMKSMNSWDLPLYTGEQFTSNGTHFVGIDGFIVPNSFEEFELRHPFHVRNWVCRRLSRLPLDPQVEDLTSELSLFLRNLPNTSKMKGRGFKDVVDVYNPWSSFGASTARFLAYINRCLANKHYTLRVKEKKDALNTPHLLPIHLDSDSAGGEGEDPNVAYEGYLVDQSTFLQGVSTRQSEETYKRIFVDSFLQYVEKERPDLLEAVSIIMQDKEVSDPTRHLRDKRALVTLGKNYLKKGVGADACAS